MKKNPNPNRRSDARGRGGGCEGRVVIVDRGGCEERVVVMDREGCEEKGREDARGRVVGREEEQRGGEAGAGRGQERMQGGEARQRVVDRGQECDGLVVVVDRKGCEGKGRGMRGEESWAEAARGDARGRGGGGCEVVGGEAAKGDARGRREARGGEAVVRGLSRGFSCSNKWRSLWDCLHGVSGVFPSSACILAAALLVVRYPPARPSWSACSWCSPRAGLCVLSEKVREGGESVSVGHVEGARHRKQQAPKGGCSAWAVNAWGYLFQGLGVRCYCRSTGKEEG